MSGFIKGEDRHQATLFPERLDDYIAEDSAVRVIDVFLDDLDLSGLGFKTEPNDTGRPPYHPSTMLKIYVYGYLNRVQSSRRLEREAQRNIELMWLTERLAPDFKTIADFRKDNGAAIRLVCREFVMLCRKLNLFTQAFVAIDGSKFKAVNNRDRNFTKAKMKRRLQQIDESIERYLGQMASADRQESSEDKTQRLEDKIAALKQEMVRLKKLEVRMLEAPDQQTSGNLAKGQYGKRDFIYIPEDDEYECPAGERLIHRLSTEEKGKTIHRYWSSACGRCAIKSQCTTGKQRRVRRWEHEAVVDAVQTRLDREPERMRARRETVEHPFGTIKSWMGSTHFLTKSLGQVSTEMSLHVLAYNMKRMMNILGTKTLIEAIGA